jgi:hypothetical protein
MPHHVGAIVLGQMMSDRLVLERVRGYPLI